MHYNSCTYKQELVVSAFNSFTAVALTTFIPQRYVSIMNALLSAGTGVLGSIQLYMKLNERMANSLRSPISMKRIALKISKEISISRELRTSEGVSFLQECFTDFSSTLESGNPIEKKMSNHLELTDSASSRSTTQTESPAPELGVLTIPAAHRSRLPASRAPARARLRRRRKDLRCRPPWRAPLPSPSAAGAHSANRAACRARAEKVRERAD